MSLIVSLPKTYPFTLVTHSATVRMSIVVTHCPFSYALETMGKLQVKKECQEATRTVFFFWVKLCFFKKSKSIFFGRGQRFSNFALLTPLATIG
jgi:hypothetical protein